jgi:hypothetical protein
VGEVVGRLPALRRVLRQRGHHDGLERRVHIGTKMRDRRGRLGEVLERDGDRALALERQPPGEQLVEHHADRVEVGGGGDGVALGLFG